jgi:hypothetical protein
MFTIARIAQDVVEGRLTELEGLQSLTRLGHPKFDVFVWFRAARQGIATGYGETTPLGVTAQPRTTTPDPKPPKGRHEGGNLRRPRAANVQRRESPPRQDRGTRFKSGATRQEVQT